VAKPGIIRETIISIDEDHEPGMFGYMPSAAIKVQRLRARRRRVIPLLGDDYWVSEIVEEDEIIRVFGTKDIDEWKAKLAAQNQPPPCPHCGQPLPKKKS